jgi:hypothetical protein
MGSTSILNLIGKPDHQDQIRVLGIDLGATNSTASQVVFESGNRAW